MPLTTDKEDLKLMRISVLVLQEASVAIPLFSPVVVPMAQSIGPLLSQLVSSPTVRLGVSIQVLTAFANLFFSKCVLTACI